MQLIILSGKGGTGKTTITASFAYLQKEGVKVDCDVEASNLHIILQGTNEEEHDFFGAKVAKIDSAKCIKCEACKYVCRFDAISEFKVDELKCEGCAACTVVCPKKAISLYDEVTGKTIITETDYGILSHADMEIGAEGSGSWLLNSEKMRQDYRRRRIGFIGRLTGCRMSRNGIPTGCDSALLVVEPTQSGLVDFLRVLELVRFFKIKPYVCINKYDLNYIITRQIYRTCWKEKVPILGEIPFDPMVKQAVNELKPVVVYPESSAGRQINMLWNRLQMKLKEDN